MARKFEDISGMRSGRLVAKQYIESNKNGSAKWLCVCDCGTEKVIFAQSIKYGKSLSCGCLLRIRKATAKHGLSSTKQYKAWAGIIQRCTNPKNHKWHRYGGRGITVCDRWRTYDNFLSDMGERPAGLSVDRIDNDGNYEPANCRWSTPKEQSNNTSFNVKKGNHGISK